MIVLGREVDEIRHRIRVDALIFQDLADLERVVREDNPDVEKFESSVFNGIYVTRNVNQRYLEYLESLRNDDSKAIRARRGRKPGNT